MRLAPDTLELAPDSLSHLARCGIFDATLKLNPVHALSEQVLRNRTRRLGCQSTTTCGGREPVTQLSDMMHGIVGPAGYTAQQGSITPKAEMKPAIFELSFTETPDEVARRFRRKNGAGPPQPSIEVGTIGINCRKQRFGIS